jgi:hypothetical protein
MIEDTNATNDAMADPPLDSGYDPQRASTANGDPAESPAAEKDPDDWVTGDEPMTGAQASYLKTLCQEAGEEYDPSLTKAAASERIEALQAGNDRRGTD